MEKNGQLTFTDDTLLSDVNEAHQFLETGDFVNAAARSDVLLNSHPEYPGLAEIYRVARYWQPRMEEAFLKDEGIDRANFLMDQWNTFMDYAHEKKIGESSAFGSARKYIYNMTAEHYKIAFHLNQAEKFGNLMNLGICFMNLGEYRQAVDTFEYAKSSIKTDARLFSLLAESYFQIGEIPKSLLLFREAFFIEPTLVDMSMVTAKPVLDLIDLVKKYKPAAADPREWVPVIGHIHDIFYVKRQLNTQQLESIRKEVYTLERTYQSLKPENKNVVGTTPRLITKYLWLYDYYSYQNYNFENASQIRDRLLELDRDLFIEYFRTQKR
jgi:tetratricopeptide (TPR) repeat protein